VGKVFGVRPSEILDAYGELGPIEALLLDLRIARNLPEEEGAPVPHSSLRSYIKAQRLRWAA